MVKPLNVIGGGLLERVAQSFKTCSKQLLPKWLICKNVPHIIDAGIATQVGGHAGEGVSELRGALGSFRIGDSQAGRHLTTPIWTQNRIYTHPQNPGRVFV